MSSITFFSPALHTFCFRGYKEQKAKNNTQRCEEENKMDKKFMNKMDDMELDMVAGGGLFDILKGGTKQVVKPVAKTLKGLTKAYFDAMFDTMFWFLK